MEFCLTRFRKLLISKVNQNFKTGKQMSLVQILWYNIANTIGLFFWFLLIWKSKTILLTMFFFTYISSLHTKIQHKPHFRTSWTIFDDLLEQQNIWRSRLKFINFIPRKEKKRFWDQFNCSLFGLIFSYNLFKDYLLMLVFEAAAKAKKERRKKIWINDHAAPRFNNL